VDGNTSDTTYQFRIFAPLGETYAVRFQSKEITGICGPLEYREVVSSTLPNFPYEEQPEGVAWAKANCSAFIPCELEYDESIVWM